MQVTQSVSGGSSGVKASLSSILMATEGGPEVDTALSASGGRSGAKVSLLAVLSTTGGGSEAETAL